MFFRKYLSFYRSSANHWIFQHFGRFLILIRHFDWMFELCFHFYLILKRFTENEKQRAMWVGNNNGNDSRIWLYSNTFFFFLTRTVIWWRSMFPLDGVSWFGRLSLINEIEISLHSKMWFDIHTQYTHNLSVSRQGNYGKWEEKKHKSNQIYREYL